MVIKDYNSNGNKTNTRSQSAEGEQRRVFSGETKIHSREAFTTVLKKILKDICKNIYGKLTICAAGKRPSLICIYSGAVAGDF